MIKITGLQELLWTAQEGLLNDIEAKMLAHMELVITLPGNGEPRYILSEKGQAQYIELKKAA